MTKEQLLTGMIIFLVLDRIDRTDPYGKRGRKAILKKVKKRLFQGGKENPEEYLVLVSEAGEMLSGISKAFGAEKVLVNPGDLIGIILFRYPEYVEPFEINPEHVNNIKDAYASSGIGFNSIKVGNYLIGKIEEYVNDKSKRE
jgi:hypothetical protein